MAGQARLDKVVVVSQWTHGRTDGHSGIRAGNQVAQRHSNSRSGWVFVDQILKFEAEAEAAGRLVRNCNALESQGKAVAILLLTFRRVIAAHKRSQRRRGWTGQLERRLNHLAI